MIPTRFLTYGVSDIKAARHFYEDILGLELTKESGSEWFEYDVGDTTFSITTRGAELFPDAVLALEVPDLDAEVARLQHLGATLQRDVIDTPVSRLAVVLDPDGNEIVIATGKERA